MKKVALILVSALMFCLAGCDKLEGSDDMVKNVITIGSKTYELDTFCDSPVGENWDPHAYDVTGGSTGDNIFILTQVKESMFNKTYDLTKHYPEVEYSIWIRAFHDNFDGGVNNFSDRHDSDFSSGTMKLTYKSKNLRLEIDGTLSDGRKINLDMTITPDDIIQ